MTDEEMVSELRLAGDSGGMVAWHRVLARARELLLSPHDEAVIAAADKWADMHGEREAKAWASADKLVKAVRARRDALRPPDRYDEVRGALGSIIADRKAQEHITIKEAVRRLNAAERGQS